MTLKYRTNNALVQTFEVNNLNELATNSRRGTLTVAGTTTSEATNVTVNSSEAVLYADNTFASTNHSLVNGTNTFTAVGQDSYGRVDTNTVSAYLPATAIYTYDDNGNLTSDGRRYFEYDDENQLTAVTVSNAWRSEFTYDGKLRRRIRKEFTWQGGTWVQTSEVHYVYDGNLVIQERDGNNLALVSYTRGKDLSGTLQGAGGIGGLLARTANQSSAFYHCDGNGNVTCLVGTNQLVVARYLYDPYGNTLSASGPLADANLYRFSSKEWHQNSGLVYYLYRFYSPSLQRWPNRDPIDEWGGFNLYRFVRNTPTRGIDAFGLSWWRGLPILNLVSCFSSEPGGNTADYASIPSPSCQDCKSDPEAAEAKCDEAVNAMESGYLGNAGGPMLLDGVGDGLMLAGGLVYKPVWLGLIPNGVATACEMKNLMNISKAAGDYKNKYCKCSQGK